MGPRSDAPATGIFRKFAGPDGKELVMTLHGIQSTLLPRNPLRPSFACTSWLAFTLLVSLTGCQRPAETPTPTPAPETTYSREQLAERTVRRRAVEAFIWGLPA